jgi:hypothetical protein
VVSKEITAERVIVHEQLESTMKSKILLAAGLCGLFVSYPLATLRAQGTGFTYQGRLNVNGSPVSGNYDLSFNLYNSSSGGSPATAGVTNATVAVSSGLFTTTLDFGPGVFTGTTYWLEIGARTNGSGPFVTLSGRQQLTPSPYAIFAESAGGVANNAITGSSIANGTVVRSLNGLSDTITLSAGANVNITPSGNSLQISATVGTADWALLGNAGTTPGVNFLGTTDTQPLELRVNNVRALRLEPSSAAATPTPNIIGGASVNNASPGIGGATIAGGGIAGFFNNVTADFGTVSGGYGNTSGPRATIGGGSGNISSGSVAVVGGGGGNTASGNSSTVSGGGGNTSSSLFATVGGGLLNTGSAGYATVGGGYFNTASGPGSFVGGGGYDGFTQSGNLASGKASAVAGGLGNFATNDYSTVSGGESNLSWGGFAMVGGGLHNVSSQNFTTVGGGLGNMASSRGATVGGGYNNTSSGVGAFVGGGGYDGSVSLGNTASGNASVVSGGLGNGAVADYSAVAGGDQNSASGQYSVVGGGQFNSASADYSMIPGGSGNTATGVGSFAAGLNAHANHIASFVWGDGSAAANSTGPNTFAVKAAGGVGFYVGSGYFAVDPTGNVNATGNGSVCTLTIRGGCDLAEPFQISTHEIPKGAVVVIDEEDPGKLKMSERAYDTRVAGIVSGANGINTGIALHQEGKFEGGENVALSGRVYVLADASKNPINPGDLLTTSDNPGHAMKVTNHAKAHGAIIGKAMSALKEGNGMVLVLVTLQ